MKVPGYGPKPATILILGEGPGRTEEIKGRPFVGRSGEQLTAALHRAAIDREQCYITNVVEERCVDKNGKDRPPTEEEIEAGRVAKWNEIERVGPRFIITLGATATRFLMPEYDRVGGLETLQGRGFQDMSGNPVIIPCVHPAAGLRDSRRLTDFFWAIKEAGEIVRGRREVTRRGAEWLLTMFPEAAPLTLDTEWTDEGLWCWSGLPDDIDSSTIFSQDMTDPTLVRPALWHNALADLGMLARQGLQGRCCDDSMVMAYHLGTEPLGLKQLAYRYTGEVAPDYEDVIEEADRARLGAYFEGVNGKKWPPPEGKKHSIPKRVDKVVEKLQEEGPKAARAFWAKHDVRPIVEAKLGPTPTTNLSHVPLEKAMEYSKRDPILTAEVYLHLAPRIQSLNLTAAYRTDIAIIPMLSRMQQVGMPVNVAKVRELEPVVREELEAIQARAEELYGGGFNLASADQVRDQLEAEGAPIDKRTRTGKLGTDKASLKAIRADSELADLSLEYRERAKNLTTFIPALLQYTQSDGRIHPNLRTTNTETGRLSCHDPNLLAFPARSKIGLAVRNCFEAPKGWVFCNSDLDQIEMRMLAHEANDANMIAAIKAGDMHAYTARDMFRQPLENVVKGAPGEKKYRTPAKSIGFLITYRGGAHKLREQMASEGIKEDVNYWQAAIDRWYGIYPQVREYQRKLDNEADTFGYIRDMWGRIRHVEGVWSPDSQLRSKVQRESGNFPIQSGAQGLLKRAMIVVWAELNKPKWRGRVEPVLQVHDELVFLAKKEVAKEWTAVVSSIMVKDAKLFSVPLGSSSGISDTWGGLK